MKTFLFIAVIFLLLVLFGWITFSQSDDTTSVNFNTDKAKQDTKKAAETAKSFTKKAVKKGKSVINDLEDDGKKKYDDKSKNNQTSYPSEPQSKQKQSDGVHVGQ